MGASETGEFCCGEVVGPLFIIGASVTISIGVSDGDAVVANNVGNGEADVDGEVVGNFEGRNLEIGAIVTCVGTTDKIGVLDGEFGVFDGKSTFGKSEATDGATDTGIADTGVCIVGVGTTVTLVGDGCAVGFLIVGEDVNGEAVFEALGTGASISEGADVGSRVLGARDDGGNDAGKEGELVGVKTFVGAFEMEGSGKGTSVDGTLDPADIGTFAGE